MIRSACARCGVPIPGHGIRRGYLCGSCRAHPPVVDRVSAVWSYRPPLDAVIQQLKFGGLAYLATHLANGMIERFRDDLAGADLLVPVPLHWGRLLRRGYNQAAEIAHVTGRALDRPVVNALHKHRATPPQSALRRAQRASNLSDTIRLRRRSDLTGCHVVLIDDVVTTGATIEGCARALKAAGARTVAAVVAGRTPPPEADGDRLAGILKENAQSMERVGPSVLGRRQTSWRPD